MKKTLIILLLPIFCFSQTNNDSLFTIMKQRQIRSDSIIQKLKHDNLIAVNKIRFKDSIIHKLRRDSAVSKRYYGDSSHLPLKDMYYAHLSRNYKLYYDVKGKDTLGVYVLVNQCTFKDYCTGCIVLNRDSSYYDIVSKENK